MESIYFNSDENDIILFIKFHPIWTILIVLLVIFLSLFTILLIALVVFILLMISKFVHTNVPKVQFKLKDNPTGDPKIQTSNSIKSLINNIDREVAPSNILGNALLMSSPLIGLGYMGYNMTNRMIGPSIYQAKLEAYKINEEFRKIRDPRYNPRLKKPIDTDSIADKINDYKNDDITYMLADITELNQQFNQIKENNNPINKQIEQITEKIMKFKQKHINRQPTMENILSGFSKQRSGIKLFLYNEKILYILKNKIKYELAQKILDKMIEENKKEINKARLNNMDISELSKEINITKDPLSIYDIYTAFYNYAIPEIDENDDKYKTDYWLPDEKQEEDKNQKKLLKEKDIEKLDKIKQEELNQIYNSTNITNQIFKNMIKMAIDGKNNKEIEEYAQIENILYNIELANDKLEVFLLTKSLDLDKPLISDTIKNSTILNKNKDLFNKIIKKDIDTWKMILDNLLSLSKDELLQKIKDNKNLEVMMILFVFYMKKHKEEDVPFNQFKDNIKSIGIPNEIIQGINEELYNNSTNIVDIFE